MEIKWLAFLFVGLAFAAGLPDIIKSIDRGQSTYSDPLSQQIQAIENSHIYSTEKAQLIKQLIDKHQATSSNSIPIANAVTLIAVESTNEPVEKH